MAAQAQGGSGLYGTEHGHRTERTDHRSEYTPGQMDITEQKQSEAALRRILSEQDVRPDAVVVTYRRIADDPRSLAREQRVIVDDWVERGGRLIVTDPASDYAPMSEAAFEEVSDL